MEVYHSDRAAVSGSQLLTYHERPMEYKGRYITGEKPDKASPGMRYGSAFHCHLLEGPEQFAKDFGLTPQLNFQGKNNKWESICALNDLLFEPLPESTLETLEPLKREDIEAFFAEHPGVEQVNPVEAANLKVMTQRVREHRLGSVLLSRGLPELSFRTQTVPVGRILGENEMHEGDPLMALQSRPDWFNPDGLDDDLDMGDGYILPKGESYVVQLKTVKETKLWKRSFANFAYWRDPEFCRRVLRYCGCEPKHYFWLICETDWPHAVQVRWPLDDVWQAARQVIDADFAALAQSLRTGHFPEEGETNAIPQELPYWMMASTSAAGVTDDDEEEGAPNVDLLDA